MTGLLVMGVLGLACGEPAPASEQKDADTKAKAEPQADARETKEGAGGAVKLDEEAKAKVAQFTKDQRKKGCEMLPPALVAKVLELPEAELERRTIMGCIYSWEGQGQVAEASIMSIWVKKTPELARTWFENSTKTVSAEEAAAQMKMVTTKAKEREEIDTKLEKDTVDQVGAMAVAMTPDEGYRYEDLPGVGDAARVHGHDGSITVLVGNMVFGVRAYKGPPAPPPDMAAMTSGNMKKVMAAAKKAENEWMAKTRDVRQELGTKLAKAIVEGL